MKRTVLLALTLCIGLSLSASAFAQDGFADQPFHLTYQIGGASLDTTRQSSDGDVWHSLGFGYFLTDNFSLDLEYDQFTGLLDQSVVSTFAPGATYRDWDLKAWSVMGRYFFRPDASVRPYVGAGMGIIKHASILDRGSEPSWGFAVGLQGKVSKHWSARGQLLWRTDNDSDSFASESHFSDFYFSVGLNLDWGGPDAPPPPPPPPPAPPPEPVNPDLDGDGVPNERDKCPNTRPGAVVDLDGCEVEAVIELRGVHFDFDKSDLKPEAIVILNEAAALLEQHETVVVEVAGHTDSVGTDAYNQGLSERRANSVRDYLVSKGIRASRLSARGYGEARPVASNDTDAGRAENRRVELVILER